MKRSPTAPVLATVMVTATPAPAEDASLSGMAITVDTLLRGQPATIPANARVAGWSGNAVVRNTPGS
ncbi:hypothetical protein [uncultured Tateyamaria sp.]|uniref:hypothetical protein n=1 Tax=uncultured Tateyamaria sp. TaxID=455651 RepID=UPI00260D3131|nr:hypothetical protein [uncultured Tateyamaria sp.]